MNVMMLDAREQFHSLCHLMTEQERASIFRKSCEIISDVSNQSMCFLFLLDATRTNLCLEFGVKIGQVNWAAPSLSVELKLEKDKSVCPISTALILGRNVVVNSSSQGYQTSQFSDLRSSLDYASSYGFFPLVKQNGNALGVFMLIGSSEQNTAWIANPSNKLLFDALSTRVEETLDRQAREANQTQLSKSLSIASRERDGLRDKIKSRPSRFVGNCAEIKKLRGDIVRFSNRKEPVMLIGQQGTFRGSAAKELHENSDRQNGRFVFTDGSFLTEDTALLSLFGAKRGSLRGASSAQKGLIREASGGTLYIENVENMSLTAQKLVWRFIETNAIQAIGSEREAEADTRIILSASENFRDAPEDNEFLTSLYHRISSAQIYVPSLNERRSDFEEIVRGIVEKYRQSHKTNLMIAADAIDYLSARQYMGNVRELISVIERAAMSSEQIGILTKDVFVMILEGSAAAKDGTVSGLKETLIEFERNLILNTLTAQGGNRRLAAEQLNIPKRTLAEKCKKYGI